MVQWLSSGVANLCYSLHPNGSRSVFPAQYALEKAHADETTAAWFKRCVDRYMDGNPERCAIDDKHRIGVLGVLDASHTGDIRYLNLQAVIVEGEGTTLADAYLSAPGVNVIYLRLDFDPDGALGSMFREPQPHIHQRHDGALWHPFVSRHPVPDFAELLFRNWDHKGWSEWTAEVWEATRRSSGQSDPATDPLPRIQSAFAGSSFPALRELASDIEKVRAALRRELDEMSDATIAGDYLSLTRGP